MRKITLIFFFIFMSVSMLQSQVLISLLFGDNLNTGKIEFGLNGGFNLSTIRGIEGAQGQNNWELGFYFDILLKEKSRWYIATGVYIKSNVGATNIPLDYEGNRVINDSVYNFYVDFDGTVEKRFNTFYVPANVRYLSKSGIFAELGLQAGLVFKTKDIYHATIDGNDLEYTVSVGVIDNGLYKWFDGGVNAGLGYKFKKGLGMSILVRYYLGLTNIYHNDLGLEAYNSSLYVLATIPIGKKKAEAKKAAKAAAENPVN